MGQWDSASTIGWKVPDSNPTNTLGQALGRNLVTRPPVNFESNQIERSDYYGVIEATSTMWLTFYFGATN